MAKRFSINDLSKAHFIKADGIAWVPKDKTILIVHKGLRMVSEMYYDEGDWVVVQKDTGSEYVVNPDAKEFVVFKML